MERILRNSETPEIISQGFDEPFLLFPVRHHSPVCSYQLIRTIKEYKPEIILIEGPENANELIPSLTAEETVLPAAFYYFYKDSKKLVSEEAEDYKCYYPFLYSSPEYNALKEAEKLGIPAKFIDLPYCEILIATANGKGLRKNSDRHSYADDSALMRGKFYKSLCEKTGLRSFEEFWEKYFEIKGLQLEPLDFIKQMHTYCILSRNDTPNEELIADGTAARESFMAQHIRTAMDEFSKVLVVTGGFHSIGLYRLLQESKIKAPKVHKIPSTHQGCYPMAFSYESADALHGYASGMSYPYFYDCVMKSLLAGESLDIVYNEQTLNFLLQTSKKSAAKDIAVSTADVTSALSLMHGLAALRNSSQCGITELFDAVTSTFIKGEKTISSSLPLDILAKIATGTAIGFIGDKSHVPPLIADFEKHCDKLGIRHATAVPKDIDIAVFATEKGMAQSRLLHRLDFLSTEFAKMRKGPDLHNNKDRSRVHEEWRYKRTPNVDAALIDHITDGFTIEEACSTFAAKKMREIRRCVDSAKIMVDCFLMGIPMNDSERNQLEEILASDGDFFSIGKAMHYFEMLFSLQQLYSFEDESSLIYLTRCFDKLIAALPSMANTPSDQADECVGIIRRMYAVTGNTLPDRLDAFEQALITLVSSPSKEPSVYGAAMGILYSINPERRKDAENAMSGFLKGSPEIKKQGADYLRGLFGSARDIVLADDAFMKMSDSLISDMEYDDFIDILPSMRLAFGYFTPNEIQTLAECVSDMHNSDKESILSVSAVDENFFCFGEKFDKEICELIGKGGLNL